MHRAHGVNSGTTLFELGLLLADAQAQVFDDGRILALQTVKLHQLFHQIPPPNIDDSARLCSQFGDRAGY